MWNTGIHVHLVTDAKVSYILTNQFAQEYMYARSVIYRLKNSVRLYFYQWLSALYNPNRAFLREG